MNNFGNHKNLLLMVLLIIFIGSFLMYSASSSFALYIFDKSDSYFFVKHIIWFLIGMVGLFILSNINYRFLKDNAILILFFSWIIMFIPILQKLLFNGDSIARWLKIGNWVVVNTHPPNNYKPPFSIQYYYRCTALPDLSNFRYFDTPLSLIRLIFFS